MNAILNGARSRSTLLTGAAGLLLLMTAVVMMVIAAPQIHQVRPGSVTHERLASWVWVTRNHWMPVTPGSGSKLTRTDLGPVPEAVPWPGARGPRTTHTDGGPTLTRPPARHEAAAAPSP